MFKVPPLKFCVISPILSLLLLLLFLVKACFTVQWRQLAAVISL